MKAIKIITAAVVIVMISTFSSFAKDNKTTVKSNLKKEISKQISYPEMAIETKKEGTVFVQFTVSEDGKLLVNQMNYLDVTFGDYVKQRLSKIKIDKNDPEIGSTHTMKFDFKLN